MSEVPPFSQELLEYLRNMNDAPQQDPVVYVGREGLAEFNNVLNGVQVTARAIPYNPTVTVSGTYANGQWQPINIQDANAGGQIAAADAATQTIRIDVSQMPQGMSAEEWFHRYYRHGVAFIDNSPRAPIYDEYGHLVTPAQVAETYGVPHVETELETAIRKVREMATALEPPQPMTGQQYYVRQMARGYGRTYTAAQQVMNHATGQYGTFEWTDNTRSRVAFRTTSGRIEFNRNNNGNRDESTYLFPELFAAGTPEARAAISGPGEVEN